MKIEVDIGEIAQKLGYGTFEEQIKQGKLLKNTK